MPSRKVFIQTLGCRVNQYESDAMEQILEQSGFSVVKKPEEADLCIVNTCTVTAESDRKCGQMIRRIAKNAPGCPIIAAGCMAQLQPRKTAAIAGVSAVIGNYGKADIARVAEEVLKSGTYGDSLSSNNIENASYDRLCLTRPRRCRSYVKIEDGCENRCAYCTIPAARGPVRSKEEAMILEEITALAQKGCEEVILTGIETASYGKDTGTSLSELLPKVDRIPGIQRIGLGSLEPNLLRSPFPETLKTLRHFLPHLHLSIQSGSSGVLKRMRRPYNARQAMDIIEGLRNRMPEIQLTADIITGFPGETEEEFEETLSFIREARFLHIHIFPYSNRQGTEADTLQPQVDPALRHTRAERLESAAAVIKSEILSAYVEAHRSDPVWVLVEEPLEHGYFGHSEHYVDTVLEAEETDLLKIIPVQLDRHDGTRCYGHKMRLL